MNKTISDSIRNLSFIEEVYTDTIEYKTDESSAPATHLKNGEYAKINIKDTLKGVCWFYESVTKVKNGEAEINAECYIIVNTTRAKLSRSEILRLIMTTFNSLGLDFDIETDATRALSRYSAFFELHKQIGKVPYLVFRVNYTEIKNLCL